MQRNFEPVRNQVEAWQRSELTDVTAKVLIYGAFVQGKLKAPKQLARTLHDRTEVRGIPAANNLESLERVHVPHTKELDPRPQFKATTKLGKFLEQRFSLSF